MTAAEPDAYRGHVTVVKQMNDLVLGGPIYRSSQPAILRDRMSAVAVTHEVYPLSGRLDGLATGVHVGQVHLAFVRYGAPTRIVAEPTGDSVCWTFPFGPMRVDWGGRRRGSYANQGFVLNPHRETVMLPEPVRGAVVLTAPRLALIRHAPWLTGRPHDDVDINPGPSRQARRGMIDSAWRHCAAVLSGVPEPPAAVLRQLEQSLLSSILLELADLDLRAGGQPFAPGTAHSHVWRAEEWVRDHLAQPIEVSAWASGVGVSVRYLQKCFQEVHGCSPMTFMQGLRLEAANRELTAHPGRSISSIAADWGFTHLGRFAALHKERYGITPSQLRRNSPVDQ